MMSDGFPRFLKRRNDRTVCVKLRSETFTKTKALVLKIALPYRLSVQQRQYSRLDPDVREIIERLLNEQMGR